MKLIENLTELIFPKRCPVCDCVLGLGEMICPDCARVLKPISGSLCRKCGTKLSDPRGEYCPECLERQHVFTEGRTLYDYKVIRRAIYRLKYMGRQEYAEFYGRAMAANLGRVIMMWDPDIIVPVPLHTKRLIKRGYNQAGLLAAVVARELNIPVDPGIIKRTRNTDPMKTLNINQRENNLKKAFKIEADVVKLDAIVLVDDIYTTGSTMDAIAGEFRKKGVKKIYFIALAAARV